jgi:hypothetical protein
VDRRVPSGEEAMTSTLVLVLKLALIVGAVLLVAVPAWGQGPIPPPPTSST